MKSFGSGLSGKYSVCLYIVVYFLLQHWEALFKDEVFWQWLVRWVQCLVYTVYNCEFLITALGSIF